AVHAHHRRRLRGGGPVHPLEVDERPAPVGPALGARRHARLAADAAAGVDDEDRVVVDAVPGGLHGGPSWRSRSRRSVVARWPVARSTRTADTLNSGMFDRGSTARLVSWLAARAPGQWYGMNTVSGRIVSTTWAGRVMDPRREVT